MHSDTATWRPRSGSRLCTPNSWLKQILKLKEGQVDALGDGHMAAKIRNLAMYAQQLAETGIKGRSGGHF
jgi:hypothetical protein